MTSYPIQYAKVQPPPLRDETLARDRLLDWLHAKIHSRVILIIADAGYGKTTLLADFARRTRLRVLWYRLDDDDLDWTSIIHHLVAAGREHDPGFAPATLSMLSETSLSGPSREAVMDVFIRELPTIAPTGAVLILDDFHLVDEAPDMRYIVRELIARAPSRVTIVFSSRRRPSIPLARLRANGEVAELSTDDLRFDAKETARLFSETYRRTLDPEVLASVTSRTEGWAASLQLVQAALRDRTPAEIRRFVRSLSGADQELYDYLAEEVVGDLVPELQQFLMQTSILQMVEPDLAAAVTSLGASEVAVMTAAAERLTLLGSRSGGTGKQLRYHPLVREFLEARLAREFGPTVVDTLHRRVAEYAEVGDWRTATYHFWLANDRNRAHEVIDAATAEIVATGEFALAESYVPDNPESGEPATFEVLRSRRDFRRGDLQPAMQRARSALELQPDSTIAAVNLASLAFNVGDYDVALTYSRRLADSTEDSATRELARTFALMIDASVDGSVKDLAQALEALATNRVRSGHSHYAGVAYLNLANCLRALGDAAGSSKASELAIDLLESISSGPELAAAHAARAWALAHQYGIRASEDDIKAAQDHINREFRWETLVEVGDIETWYGSLEQASQVLGDLQASRESSPWAAAQIDATRAQHAIRSGDLDHAAFLLEGISLETPCSSTAQKARVLAMRAHLSVAAGESGAAQILSRALRHARRQGAGFWVNYNLALSAASGEPVALCRYLRSADHDRMAAMSMVAELLTPRLQVLGTAEFEVLGAEAALRPARWRDALRAAVEADDTHVAAARLLEAIGTSDDVAHLRQFAKAHRGRPESQLGKALARRVAFRVRVEDQGRVRIVVGDQTIEGSTVRRRVLGLLCFLLSRPRFSAARDEVLDALWPDVDPADALNSLNQTVYFLRRVFEPSYREDLSPGYLNHEGDVVWLDPELVTSRSQQCWDLIRRLPAEPSPAQINELSETYEGPFALEFAYEEWATPFRTSLQSGYLQVIETSVLADTESGHFQRGILVARRALQACPEADNIELSLVRLYKLSGSHAAAAEQYTHYSSWLRDALGVEPPALDSL